MLSQLLKRQRTEFWGNSYDFIPKMLDKVFGDGKQLLLLFPINERPRYWVVRVDSKCTNDDAVYDIIDEIYEAIDEQFGTPDESDIGIGEDRPYFPQFDGQGVSWHFVRGTDQE